MIIIIVFTKSALNRNLQHLIFSVSYKYNISRMSDRRIINIIYKYKLENSTIVYYFYIINLCFFKYSGFNNNSIHSKLCNMYQ